MMQEYEIREFTIGDLDDVYSLVQETIDASYPAFYPPAAVKAFSQYHSPVQIKLDAEEGYTVILRIDGRIIGTGTLSGTSIKRVFIHPCCQGKGYGRLVIAILEKKAMTHGTSILDLAASLGSQQFYDSLGYRGDIQEFIPVGNGEKLFFYPMTKTLKDTAN